MNEVKMFWTTGLSLTFSVYFDNAGTMTARETGTAMTEEPVASELYVGTAATIIADDVVKVRDATGLIGEGQYRPEVTNPALVSDLADHDDKLDIVDANVDLTLTALNKVKNTYDERDVEPPATVIID